MEEGQVPDQGSDHCFCTGNIVPTIDSSKRLSSLNGNEGLLDLINLLDRKYCCNYYGYIKTNDTTFILPMQGLQYGFHLRGALS